MVIVCRCAYANTLPVGAVSAAEAAVQRAGCEAAVVADLCELAATQPERLRGLVGESASLIVLACRPRAVQWLLHRADLGAAAAAAQSIDLREADAETITRALPEGDGTAVTHLGTTGAWQPWFPVIDYDRCSTCKQCLNFCLFGVYEEDHAGRVTVAHPEQCKNQCPACARICPDVAIMFPKLPPEEAPLDGAAVTDEIEQTTRVQKDMTTLLGDDVYAALEARKQKRQQRLLKREAREKAERERQHCAGTDAAKG